MREHRSLLETLVKNNAKNCCSLLDAGCGKGGSMVFPPKNAEIVGVDVLRTNVADCKRRWKNRGYVVADLSTLPFIEKTFGGVICIEVLEHVGNKTALLNELSRITQKGGFFIGDTTNILNPILWLDVKFPRLMKPLVEKLTSPGHYERHSRFGPSSLTNTLKLARYRISFLSLVGYPMFSLSKKLNGLAFLWVLFDRVTKKTPLRYLKEVLVWEATRT
jgi:ubiquinone/menaquinone biosynthesis C-methylase UbiE